ARAENRRKAAYKAKLTRSLKKAGKTKKDKEEKSDEPASNLRGWEEFDIDPGRNHVGQCHF
ncbi:hypothetical protein AB4048_24810, partial [Rhizobium sp. RAF56]